MTPKQADRLIAKGEPVRLFDRAWPAEVFTATLVRRDRRRVYAQEGYVLDRGDLELAIDN